MSSSLSNSVFPLDLAGRLQALISETVDERLTTLEQEWREQLDPSVPHESSPSKADFDSFRDRLSTVLMDLFRITQKREAFGLLYEVKYRIFLGVITARLRKFYFALDPQDVLQEVFFNIYRYPHKFHADRDQAFRFWASMIIRNTVFKAARDKDREVTHELQDEEIETREDRQMRSPLGAAIRGESARICSKSYLSYLAFYLAAYRQLSERERLALHIVEVEGEAYKVAAERLSIRLENLKMVIFRARKKILRSLDSLQSRMESWSPEDVGGEQLARGLRQHKLERFASLVQSAGVQSTGLQSTEVSA